MCPVVYPPRYSSANELVVDAVRLCSALSRRQVAELCFGGGNYAEWKARTVLKKLYDLRFLRRGRCAVANDYVYWAKGKPDNLEHLILINWVYVTTNKTGQLNHFTWRTQWTSPIPDGYFIVRGKPFFLEVQRSVNHKDFDKVEKYTTFFESKIWDDEEWPTPGMFARIVIVADRRKEADRINRIIIKKNSIGLRFIVTTVQEIWEAPLETLFAEPAKEKVISWAGFGMK